MEVTIGLSALGRLGVIFECCKNDTEDGVVVDRKTRPIVFKCVRPYSIDEALIYAHGRPYRGRRVGEEPFAPALP